MAHLLCTRLRSLKLCNSHHKTYFLVSNLLKNNLIPEKARGTLIDGSESHIHGYFHLFAQNFGRWQGPTNAKYLLTLKSSGKFFTT